MKKCPHWALAVATGARTYSTGQHCRRGHNCERTTSDRICVECARSKHSRDPVRMSNYQMAWRRKRIAADPTYRDRLRAAEKRWRDRNKHLARLRRHIIKERTPAWSEREQIADFYAGCPTGHEVDHIVPLKGRFVSGLHVLKNLQYLPKRSNRKKSNSFTPG